VEVASNDGYLLRNFVARGIRALGVDPARGPAAAAAAVGVPTVVGFFGPEVARGIVAEHGHADVVIANNVMAHVPDLDDFVAGLSELLAPGGVLTIENPYVRSMIEQVEFDTIYHEHYCYFSTSAVDALMRRHGLYVNHVEHFAELHGGTNRWHIGRTLDRSDSCRRHLEREQSDGLTTVGYYQDFAGAAHACQKALRVLVEGLVADGATVAAYGAAAKGATLLNSAGIGADLVSYVVDRNVHKQGRFMPGCLLEILPPEALIERKPDFVVLLAWNFAAEIMAQQREYTRGGGRFIVPVPMPRIAGEGASPEPGGPAGDPGTDPA